MACFCEGYMGILLFELGAKAKAKMENLADISSDTGGVDGMCSSPKHSRLSAAFPHNTQV